MSFGEEGPDDDNDDRDQEHKNGDAVDPVHIFDPATPRSIRVLLLNVKIFRQLSPYPHIIAISWQR